MSYDFKDLAAFHGVMVFCEQRQGNLMPTDFELVSEARKLADDLGTEVIGLAIGSDCTGMPHDIAGYGADKVIVCEDPRLKTIPPMPTAPSSATSFTSTSRRSCSSARPTSAVTWPRAVRPACTPA
jgi:electron transfer flavoprotein alpha subunit